MPSRRSVAAALGLGLAGSALTFTPAGAAPGGTGLVISEVYGGGGNAGAQYTNDFVELYNPTSSAVTVDGMSVQYRSATGTSAQVTPLSGSVPAGGHYLVQEAAGTTPSAALPTPDATGAISMSGSNGVVLLVPTTTQFATTGNLAGNPGLLDMVGYGTTPTSFETANTGVALTNTTAAARASNGADTDDNAADFSEGAPDPQNAGSQPPPPPTEVDATIAEVQGTDTGTSPHKGDTVTTQGVVTAAYPTGGFNGFYIQTEGTGGATDATPGASDGIFVFGGSALTTYPEVGDFVEVTGPVSEFGTAPNTLTEITVDNAGVTDATGPSDPVTPLTAAYPTTTADREAHEGELFAPTNQFTVTNTFNVNNFAEIGLATGTTSLIAPTEVEDAQTGDVAGVAADNAARAVALDDGASINYLNAANQDTPLPWLSTTNPVRVGATATLQAPVVLDWRNNVWKFQPTHRVTDEGAAVATFENTRPANNNPQDVGGDIKLATFNVLNYFPTTAEEFAAQPGNSCTYFDDRDGNHIGANTCTPNGPRGAANTENFERQQSKIVTAINRLDASIVSLEELENSAKFGKSRDFAIAQLVSALNADAGAGTWDFAPTPPADQRPTVDQEDVIRTGFIYKPAEVALVGGSRILQDEVHFGNAREPLAQAFKAAGAPDSDAFTVIVNHFKSKGSGTDDGTGQGNANPDRIGQAHALVAFADAFAADRGTDAVFFSGDFNSYSQEDPMQVLYDAGYDAIESDTAGEETYSFSGLSGSLDHVLGNAAAMAMVTGADVWNINSPESVAFQYSRYNYNVTQFFDGTVPFAASDHDPEIVGLDVTPDPVDVQILGTNDFHGRILNNTTGSEAGAAVLSGAVKQLRAQNPDTVFAAAGDLIGASTFESFIQKDKPTIDALNEAGLEVSAAGNHEFDQGYDDLVNRVMAPYDAETNPYGGAQWKYLAANVHKAGATGDDVLDPTYVKEMDGVQVGFIGAVTEELPSLVSPAGMQGVTVEDIVTATNREADRLEADGVDVIVLLVHEGAATTSLASATDPSSPFGAIVNGVDENVDAIVSGHTHLSYNHSVPVQAWVDEGRAVTERPVVSAGQYGMNLNKLVFTVDPITGDVSAKTQSVLPLKANPTTPNYPADPAVTQIVDAAKAKADELGKQELGTIAGPFKRARSIDPVNSGSLVENRGGESTLGNLVAEVQRWATESETAGSAQIAFMNPGGLRADMVGTAADGYPEVLTYRQAADVQPFANTLVNMRLTGAQIKTVLEQQWQRDASGNVPSRPFLRLGVSKGFDYTYDPARPEGDRITQMWLNGDPIVPSDTYSVTANSFLASGGDNFRAFSQGTNKRDTGKVDLQAMVDYMDTFAGGADALSVDWAQHAVGVSFPATAPATYLPGDHVTFDVSSLAMTGVDDRQDAEVEVSLGDSVLGSVPVDNARGNVPTDEYGKASVDVVLPAGTPAGEQVLTVTGATTGTTTEVPITVEAAAPVESTTTATAPAQVKVGGGTTNIEVTVSSAAGAPTPTGEVVVSNGGNEVGRASLVAGHATLPVGPFGLVGTKEFTVSYSGDAATAPSESPVSFEVVKRNATIVVDREPRRVVAGETRTVLTVDVTTGGGITPSGRVEVRRGGEVLQAGRLDAGSVRLRLPVFGRAGEKTVKVVYLGDGKVLAETVDYTFTVQSR